MNQEEKDKYFDASELFMQKFTDLLEEHSQSLPRRDLFQLTIRCTEKYFNEKESWLHGLNLIRLHHAKLKN